MIVSGRLRQRSYETKEGEKRTVVEVQVDDVGPALRYATAKVTRAARGGPGGGGGFGGGGFGGDAAPGDDPWSSGPAAAGSAGGAWGGGGAGAGAAYDEPPF